MFRDAGYRSRMGTERPVSAPRAVFAQVERFSQGRGYELTDLFEALDAAFDSDIPTTTTDAAAAVAELKEKLDELPGWVSELTELLDEVDSLGQILAEDDDDTDLPAAHSDWIEAVDRLRYHLTEALPDRVPA